MTRTSRLLKGLQCPRDRAHLREIEVDVPGRNVRVDVCPDCGGMWLDPGELRRLLGDRKLTDHLTRDIGTSTSSPVVCP
ncbi:MAG: zf-TFIIB domain-containing protein, partial [Thermoplasmata archaeon]|nr:zf-TFIIB domain-containing protein [Thermoplasmata archaeon]